MENKTKRKSGEYNFSTGIESLDAVLQGLVRGDNVVWEMNEIDDYIHFLLPYCRHANENDIPLIYFRFAQHKYLLPEDIKVHCYELDAHAGFEHFISEIFNVIEKFGKGACYVFDCLSELSVDWYSDRMLGNFFMLTCPYLFDYDTIAYFMLSKNQHTPFAVEAIHNTSQLVIDVFRSDKQLYLLPIKVQNIHAPDRHSSTMYTLHSCAGDKFKPVTKSAIVSKILSKVPQPWLDFNIDRRDIWTETFLEAQKMNEEVYRNIRIPGRIDSLKDQLIRMILTRDENLFELCHEYFSMEELIEIGKRMVGTGLIGGKSTGMLLARAILRASDQKWEKLLETHDSFFIGSDVYYTYIITNDCWWDRRALKSSKLDFKKAEGIGKKILDGTFSDDVIEQFKEMLNYFGQSPIIVRSSSLLEDAYGNAFSGKYESVFCSNQGTPEERLESFIDAVKTVYVSTVSEDALTYRAHRGLLEHDEQMALLVQRVSGEAYKDLYFPNLAGVGYSFNPFVWSSKIEASEGVLRLVFGLGTHAVDRVGDDYTRIVAINEPLLRPEMSYEALSKYSQKIVDILDLKRKELVSYSFEKVLESAGNRIPLEIFAEKNEEIEARAREMKIKDVFSWVLTFDNLLTDTKFLDHMSEILKTLEKAYNYPVDIEFCINFLDKEKYQINLLQCRPFQIARDARSVQSPKKIKAADTLIKVPGQIIGESTLMPVDRLIYVSPDHYSKMPAQGKYSVARLIGEITNLPGYKGKIMLVGPGRWGTRMPEMGIPVTFTEIRNTSVLCEMVTMHEGLTPDVSLGTHFFNDMVEMGIIYMAVYPNRDKYRLNIEMLKDTPNKLLDLRPEAGHLKDAVRVIEGDSIREGKQLNLHVDSLKQEGVLFLAGK